MKVQVSFEVPDDQTATLKILADLYAVFWYAKVCASNFICTLDEQEIDLDSIVSAFRETQKSG